MPLYSSLAAPVLSRLTLGGNISSSAWTTNGIGIAHSSRTITDTSSTGTVALGYTNVLGNNTIAASSAATFTDYATLQLGQPTAGTNVTFTNRWALELGGALRSTGFSLTGSQAQSLFDLAATWNTSGTPTAIKMNVTDTASAAGSLLLDLQVGGTSQFAVEKGGTVNTARGNNGIRAGSINVNFASNNNALAGGQIGIWDAATQKLSLVDTQGLNLASDLSVRWSSTTSSQGTVDLSLFRDAADTLAQRRGTNAQAFRVYETFTDVSNYSRLSIGYSSAYTAFAIERQNAGTGSARGLVLNGGGVVLGIAQPASATYSWTFNSSGHFLAGTDNTYDIGASGANRPRNIYAGTLVTAPTITSTGHVTAGAGSYFRVGNGNVQIGAPSDGVMTFYNSVGTDFSRLQFGGTTSAFPSLKRDGAGVSIRLADDSAATFIKHNPVTVASLPAAATAGAGARMFVSDASAPVFGSAVAGGGAVTVPVYSTGSAWNVG